MRYAYVTLITSADYVPGALALARSLKVTGCQAPLLVLATPAVGDVSQLEAAGARIHPIRQPVLSRAFRERHARGALHARSPFTNGHKPDFHDPVDNFCKLQLWQLDQYERIVFLDADVLVVKNIDKLFGYPEFCGAPNLYETLSDMHRLNSGVFVAAPSKRTYEAMLERLDRPGAYWRRTDQTFLQDFFPDWHGLPYCYNTLQYVFFNLPDLWHWPSIRVVHYQYEKPWQAGHPRRDQLGPLIELWHTVFDGGCPPDKLEVLPSP